MVQGTDIRINDWVRTFAGPKLLVKVLNGSDRCKTFGVDVAVKKNGQTLVAVAVAVIFDLDLHVVHRVNHTSSFIYLEEQVFVVSGLMTNQFSVQVACDSPRRRKIVVHCACLLRRHSIAERAGGGGA